MCLRRNLLAEMSSTVPVAGSAYTYSYATLGEFVAWIIGWDLILEYSLGSMAVAVGWSEYVGSFFKGFGITIPAALMNAPIQFNDTLGAWESTGAIMNLPAMLIIIVVTCLLAVGIEESAKANSVIVVVKVTIVLLFIVCLLYTSPSPRDLSTSRMPSSA